MIRGGFPDVCPWYIGSERVKYSNRRSVRSNLKQGPADHSMALEILAQPGIKTRSIIPCY
jgi:hypothetical protein